jgi:hypothetical protein
MWGSLSEKNSRHLPSNTFSLRSSTPYWELSLGIHNIFKLFHVEYVRRLNYLDLPTAHKHGVRLMLHMKF